MLVEEVLEKNIQSYINEMIGCDINSLVLKGSPFKDVSIKDLVQQIQSKTKSKHKLPTWFNKEGIYYPEKLSIEQTSSEQTALYKSSLVKGDSIIDITGGFGVDCYYFSKQFTNVVHCEINKSLSQIVIHNLNVFGIENTKSYASDGMSFLEETSLNFDCIYIDPSRRNDVKGKVFLLKDCLPNVPENLDFLFTKSNTILIKNSPILDITALIKELRFVKELHIIAVNNEVKEVLVLIQKDFIGNINAKTINITKNRNQVFEYVLGNSSICKYELPLKYLYEPNLAIMKSGAFSVLSEQMDIAKLHQNSHLYTTEKLIEFPGRSFKIIAISPYDKKKIRKLIQGDKINITVRNFSKSVAQIRKETKLKDGGDLYMFCTKNLEEKNIVIICEAVKF